MDTGATFHFHIMARCIFALLFRETVSFLSPLPHDHPRMTMRLVIRLYLYVTTIYLLITIESQY